MSTKPANTIVKVFCTERQKAVLVENAEASGLKIGEYFRECVRVILDGKSISYSSLQSQHAETEESFTVNLGDDLRARCNEITRTMRIKYPLQRIMTEVVETAVLQQFRFEIIIRLLPRKKS